MKLKKKEIIIITILITAALIGLIIVQVRLLKDSYDQEAQIFNYNVTNVLKQTAGMLEMREAAGKVFEYFVNTDSVHKENKNKNKQSNRGYSYSYTTGDNNETNYNVQRKNDSVLINGVFINAEDTTLIYLGGKDTLHSNIRFFSQIKGKHPDSVSLKYIYSVHSDSIFGNLSVFDEAAENIKKLDSTKKKVMVTGIVDRLLLMDRVPLELRLNNKILDSLLNINLKNSGIDIPYSYKVIIEYPDSTKEVFNKHYPKELSNAEYKSILFPNEGFIPSKNILLVSFSEVDIFLYKQIITQLLLSLLFILIIISGFIYTLHTIYKQKKFGGLIIEFINNMTHEFKTPIATISLASEAIKQPEVIQNEEKLSRYNQIIDDENRRMKKQVDRILQMAVLEQGDYELSLEIIDVHKIINDTLKNFILQIDKKGGKLGCALNADRFKIKGDSVHLTNIISNILENGVKYSGAHPDIFISTQNIGDRLLIKISDKGIGIKPEDIGKVFDKYYRVSTGNRHDIKGFGIGLSYVNLMVKAHKGEIKINSSYGEGTTVEVIFQVNHE